MGGNNITNKAHVLQIIFVMVQVIAFIPLTVQKPVFPWVATPAYHTATATLTAVKKRRTDTENIQTKASRRDAQPHDLSCDQRVLGMLP